jgi:hypothetical protein
VSAMESEDIPQALVKSPAGVAAEDAQRRVCKTVQASNFQNLNGLGELSGARQNQIRQKRYNRYPDLRTTDAAARSILRILPSLTA